MNCEIDIQREFYDKGRQLVITGMYGGEPVGEYVLKKEDILWLLDQEKQVLKAEGIALV